MQDFCDLCGELVRFPDLDTPIDRETYGPVRCTPCDRAHRQTHPEQLCGPECRTDAVASGLYTVGVYLAAQHDLDREEVPHA